LHIIVICFVFCVVVRKIIKAFIVGALRILLLALDGRIGLVLFQLLTHFMAFEVALYFDRCLVLAFLFCSRLTATSAALYFDRCLVLAFPFCSRLTATGGALYFDRCRILLLALDGRIGLVSR